MKGKLELQPIFEIKKSWSRIWGYEVLYRGEIPNDLLFKVSNPAFEIELFKKELEATKEFDSILTFNLSLSTVINFSDEIEKFLKKRENIMLEITEIPYDVNFISISSLIKDRLIIDDFLKKGSGIDRLIELKPFAIKVEKEFVSILNLNELKSNFLVIIERVENLQEIEDLNGKADFFQGYVFKPYFLTIDL